MVGRSDAIFEFASSGDGLSTNRTTGRVVDRGADGPGRTSSDDAPDTDCETRIK